MASTAPKSRPQAAAAKPAAKRTRSATPARRDAAATQEALIAAAVDEFSRNGYAGARVDEIASAAGVNKQLVYHYFE
ncbi:MAG TPA: helix-turn-helix domain-containing protein, partial [Variovorax sp.]|nr:helix-turn-helix domain-containing protein [Variovorax sp.]